MKVIVGEHKCTIDKTPVNELEVNVTKVQFEFDSKIPESLTKEAYFTLNGNTYKKIIFNNECDIPSEVLVKKGQVEIGVVAFEVENEQTLIRFNPRPAYFTTWSGSLKDAENSEPITPSEMEQYEQQLQDGLTAIDDKIDEVDTKIETIDDKINEVNTAIEETNNLDIDIDKQNKETTITLTKKDGTTKTESVLDGKDLQFVWRGTELGVKTSDMQDYQYTDLQGVQGQKGDMGSPFTIANTYSSEAQMIADYDNMQVGDYVMIDGNVELQENATLWVKEETPAPTTKWHYLADFSGASGIQGETGATPNIQIGTVTSGATPSVTRTGTDENPVFNFVLEKGDTGETGATGQTGATGNGISNITKTSTSGLVDTYTITYTDGTTQTYEVTNGEDGEVTQAQLDEVIAENDYLNSIIDQIVPKTTGTGTSITLDDTLQARMNMSLSPSELEQETTTGKNLFDTLSLPITKYGVTISKDANGNIVLNGTPEIQSGYINFALNDNFNLKANTYTISLKQKMVGIGVSINTTTPGGALNITMTESTTTATATTTADLIGGTLSINVRYDVGTLNNYILNPQLEEGSTATLYEPYTNGASPNPQYPQEVHTISGSNTLKVIGQNIWNEEWELGTYNWSNGQPATSTTSIRSKNKMLIKPSTEYYVKITSEIVIEFFDENNVFLGSSTNVNKLTSGTFTTPANAKYFQLYLTNAYGTTYKNDICINVSNANVNGTYKPYSLQTQDIDLGDLEYSKIGNYADVFYKATDSDTSLISGKWYLKKNIGKSIFDGSDDEGWGIQSTNYFRSGNIITNLKVDELKSNIGTYISLSNLSVNTDNRIAPADNNRIWCRFSQFNNDLASFKTFLSTTNLILDYQLSTPQYILLNDTLQSQLDTIESMLLSYKGQTNISQINNDLPFIMTSTALKELS